MLGPEELTITQRMRLEFDKVQQFTSNLRSCIGASILLAVCRDGADKKFRTEFVSYLQERNAAGVVKTRSGYLLYLFPPGEVALGYLGDVCPDLDLSKEDNYLLAALIPPTPPTVVTCSGCT
jgi:hypothetical protein